MLHFNNNSKIGTCFRIDYILRDLMLKIKIFIFISWTNITHFRKKKNKIWGNQTNCLSGGPSLTSHL